MKCLLLLVLTLASAEPAAHYKPYQDVAAREEPAVQNTTLYPPRPTTGAPQAQLRALCASPRGRFPHPLDCRKYLDCWDGRVLEVQCPNDLAYSDLSGGFCDYLEYVDCGARPVKPLPEEGKVAPSVPQTPTLPPAASTNSSAEPLVTPPAPLIPPKDFSYISGKYYFFSQDTTDWNTAQSLCRLKGVGSDLVSIKSELEWTIISDRILRLETASPAPSVYKRGNYYIGLNDQQTEGQWVWSNMNKTATYTNWRTNEPDGSRAENCVALTQDQRYPSTDGWFDVGCSQQLRFICEWDPTVIGGVVPSPQVDNLVPPGFMKLANGGRYLISTVLAPSFEDAGYFCSRQGEGSGFVSLETQSEFSLMKATLSNIGRGSYYVDVSQSPSAPSGVDQMVNCVIMNQNIGFSYDTVSCYQPFFFVCEWTPKATNRQHIDSLTAYDTNFFEGHEMMASQQIIRRRKLKRRQ